MRDYSFSERDSLTYKPNIYGLLPRMQFFVMNRYLLLNIYLKGKGECEQ